MLDALRGSSPLSIIEHIADKRLELVRAVGLSGRSKHRAVGGVVDAKILTEVGVGFVQGIVNLLNGAGHVHGRAIRVGLDFPDNILDAVTKDRIVG